MKSNVFVPEFPNQLPNQWYLDGDPKLGSVPPFYYPPHIEQLRQGKRGFDTYFEDHPSRPFKYVPCYGELEWQAETMLVGVNSWTYEGYEFVAAFHYGFTITDWDVSGNFPFMVSAEPLVFDTQ